MNGTRAKDGPIHFYPTNDRDAFVANVVEYCVQIGEHQPLLRSQAAWLVTSRWRGGGARLTPAGRRILRLYRGVEALSEAAAKPLVAALRRHLKGTSRRR